jgi:hypothetical protein
MPMPQGGGAWGSRPDKGQAMTDDKARKNAIRQRMTQTGEPYSVARRRTIETAAAAPESHLIGDEETRRIATSFITTSPWLGNATWQDIAVGSQAEYLAGWNGTFDPGIELAEGQRWSWSVTFIDPSGQQKRLTHELVLEGLRALIYGDQLTGADSLRLLRVKQWFTEPAVERRKLELSASDSSRICQQALYGHQVFTTEDDRFGVQRLDFFSDQRPPQDEER